MSFAGQIAWGATSLAYLYERMKEACCHNTRQLTGYFTLLQYLILEHFPHIMHIERSPDYVEGMPLCRRLRLHRPIEDVVSIRQYLDRIRYQDIIWTPASPSPHDQLLVPPMTHIHHHYLHYQDHLLDECRRGSIVTHAGECTHGYLDRAEGTSTGTQDSSAHERILVTEGTWGKVLTHEVLDVAQRGRQSQCTRITRMYQQKRKGGDDSTS
ncbi:Aminotransferase-like, plant mobile domain [Sesbania bispinosa]|nr:Aminotransferase-like, plant mobile domain [Sesbania bispinosa]